MKEVIISAKSVEAAVAQGAEALGLSADTVKYEILEDAKKGILGFGATDAKVRIYTEDCTTSEETVIHEEIVPAEAAVEEETDLGDLSSLSPENAALKLLNTIISDMGLNAKAEIKGWEIEIPDGKSIPEKTFFIEITGEGLGSLIGRHGDVLDSLQYLANIAAGRHVKSGEDKKEYIKISLDIENYREKREQTLKALARRMADKARRYNRNITLEPMLAYERKIIHAELQKYDDVYTYSVGSDSDRKVVIALGSPEAPLKPGRRSVTNFRDLKEGYETYLNQMENEALENSDNSDITEE